ncbi:integral peroxisomal membrane peroxin-domain-containing protein [Massariosphaeria phaeospora]|uniref:Integral peroxisomal membrane peroxin-domain-containing protein n=1 Tax=Massariosphaeria phaeospora TaxID=100035 RepID=A0A7C8I1I5_9PLEO|nr:integral peroxisomal membrane peroxin-domain-containing protein [Massariosphaeria phaeospora]
MSGEQADAVVNRDAAIPIVSITGPDDHSSVPTPSSQDSSGRRLSASKLKDKLESLGEKLDRQDTPNRVSDRLFTMLLSNVLPAQDSDSDTTTTPHSSKDRRSRTYVDRPQFSLPVMSSNFRRFNSRIGVAFVFQNRAIRLFTWRAPTQTVAFLFVYTFVCVNPTLLAVLPLACCLFFVMVPAFLARHPPPPTYDHATDMYPLDGPPVAGARTIKPAPELSKDFFRNMRDLQNIMEDFSRVHDAVLAFLTPLTNFSNEALSSTLYLLLLFTSCLLFITAHLLPWRFIMLLVGYAATTLSHPSIQALIATPETETLLLTKEHEARSLLLTLAKADVALETHPEAREVEIFELQHRALHNAHGEYEAVVFSAAPYAPLSPARIAGDRPRGTPFFEDVLPPRGWRWTDKKWMLDLLSREWVEERCVTGVEVEIEGERWVTDLHYEVLEEGGGGSGLSGTAARAGKGKKSDGGVEMGHKELERDSDPEREVLRRTWEQYKPSRKGEWRRRRWVRGVERVSADGGPG